MQPQIASDQQDAVWLDDLKEQLKLWLLHPWQNGDKQQTADTMFVLELQ